MGEITVNDGAKKAIIENQKSLLSIGIEHIEGNFKRGEIVSVYTKDGVEFARGIVNDDSDACKKVIGCHSDSIVEILGFKNYDAIITRDNITIL